MKKIIALLLAVVMVLSMGAMFSGCAADEPSVYYLNFKPEADAAWQELAALYTEQTGVKVTVVTAAGGEYESTLTAEMAKSEAPTLFQCGNQQALANWADYCLDLSDAAVTKEMTTDEYNIKDAEGKTRAIAYCYESYGIIVNTALLEQAGHSLDEITNFETLKAVAEDIHARAEELGFDAFSPAGLDGTSAWRFSGHLANLPMFYEFRDNNITEQPATVTGAYLENYKNIWDLYINNSSADPVNLSTSTSDESAAAFGTGKAVFYQNGSWEWASLTGKYGMNPADLAMIPIYCGVEGEEQAGLCSGTENCWAVNAKASEADQKATLDFLYWVVTSDEGTQMMADELGAVSFKNAKVPTNGFCADAQEYADAGCYNVSWAFNHTPNTEVWRSGVVSGLTAYSAGTGDWSAVETAFVEGWATQYAAQNG